MVFGLFLAYHISEISDTDRDSPMYEYLYPKEFRRVIVYNTPKEQLDAYANTHCSASQMITANSWEEFDKKVEQMHKNFNSKKWLEKNIIPYV